MAEQENDPFKEFGGKAINANRVSSPAVVQDETDPFAEFGGKTIKKKVGTVASPTPSQPSKTSFGANSFGSQPINEYIGKDREQQVYKELREQPKPNFDIPKDLNLNPNDKRSAIEKDLSLKRAQKLDSKGTDAMNSLSVGVNKLYSGIAKAPRYIYELAGGLQNILAKAVENNAGKEAGDILRTTDQGSYDALLKEADKFGIGGMSPLTMIDKLGTYFDNEAKDYEKKAIKYDNDIIGSLATGNLEDAGAQLVNNVIGSVPAMLEMYATGGAGKAMRLPAFARTTLSALPFASSNANEIRDNKDIPDYIKPFYSLANGYTEVVFDQSFGSQQILNKITKTLTNSGEKEALKVAKDVTRGYFKKAFDNIKEPLTDFGKNAIEEMSTQVSQNILDKLVVDPDKDLMEGVLDAGITGGATGLALSSVNTVLKSKQKADINAKNAEIESLDKDLDNPNIPQSTKQVIEETISAKKQEINNEIENSKEQFNKLSEEQKEQALEISAKINDIETSLEQEDISETAKQTLAEQAKVLDKELDEIKPVEQSKPKTDTEYFDVYKDAVDKSKTVDEAYTEVTKDGKVLSDTFVRKYNPDGTLTQPETFERFYEQVKPHTVKEAMSDKGIYYYNGERGSVTQDGQTVQFETPTKIIELGNVDEISDKKIADLGVEREVPLNISVREDNSVDIDGVNFKNNYSNRDASVNYDKDGNVVSVNLETEDGKKRTFRGQRAEEIAYQYTLKSFEENGTTEQLARAEQEADRFIEAEREVKPTNAKTKVAGAKIKPTAEVNIKTEVITPTEEVKAVEEVKPIENENIQSVPKTENVEKVEVPVKQEAKQVDELPKDILLSKGNRMTFDEYYPVNSVSKEEAEIYSDKIDQELLENSPKDAIDRYNYLKDRFDDDMIETLTSSESTPYMEAEQQLGELIGDNDVYGYENIISAIKKSKNDKSASEGKIKPEKTVKLKGQTEQLSHKAETLLNNSISEYEKADKKRQKELVNIVKEQLKINENSESTIGMGLDKDAVKAGKEFIKRIEANTEPKGTANVRNQEDAGKSEKTDEKVKVGDPIRAFADKVRSGKINKLGGFKASTGFDGAWDLGLETIALTLDGGAKVADAIQAGLEAIKKTDWYKNLADKKDFDEKYNAHMEAEYENEAKEYKKTTGINQEKIDETRRGLGMEEIERLRKSDVELGKQAQKWIEDGNSIPDLLKRLEKGALPTDVENVVLRDYISSLEARNNKKPTAELMSDINRATKLVTSSRSELGRALRAGVGEVEVVDNLSNFILDEMDAMGVETIPQDLIDELADKYAKGQEAKKAYEEGYEKAKQEAIEQQAQSELNKAKAKAKQRPNVKKTSSDYASERKEIVNSIREKLKKARSQANAVPVPYLAELIAISPDVAKLAKSYVEQGVSKLDDLVKKIKEDLQEDIPDITDTEVRDLIAGEYRTKRPTKSDILANVRELQTQARLLKQIEDLENGKMPTTDVGKIRRSKEIDELKKQIKDLEDETGVTDIRGNKARRTYLQNQIDKLKNDIALGNFEKENEVPRKIKLDAETQKKQDEYIEFQKETWKRRDAAKYEQLSVPRKAWNKFQEFLGLRRLIQTSLDFSMPFRQAITVTINPRYFKTTLSSFENMFKSTFSEKKFNRIMFAIENDPLYKDMLEDKLIFSDVDSKDNLKRDEDFRTSFLYHIPYLREPFLASNRAAAGYINTARYELYLKGVERLRSQGISREQYPDHYKSMANWAMNLTGRGKLLEFMENSGQAQRVLGDTFYGARLMASRFNLLNPNTYVKMPKEVRVEALKDMASYASVAAVTLIAMSAMGASVSLDPDDPDFLKAKWGTKRYDFTTGGMSVYLRFFFKLAKATAMRLNPELYGENKNKSALKEANKYGAHALKNTMNFFRYKLAPNTGYVVSGVAGTDALGKDFDPTEALNFAPMYTSDMIEAFKKDEGATSTYQVLLPNIFGIGMQDYDNKKSGSKKTTSAEREKARQERRDKREKD